MASSADGLSVTALPSQALVAFAMIAANGGITSAMIEQMTAAVTEYRSMTAQDSTNKPMQIPMSRKYRRLSRREGGKPIEPRGSWSLAAMRVSPGEARLPGLLGDALGHGARCAQRYVDLAIPGRGEPPCDHRVPVTYAHVVRV